MTLPLNETMSCFFSLVLIFVFIEIGLKITIKCFKYKIKTPLYMGLSWIGVSQFWMSSFLNPFLILTNLSIDGLSAEMYYFVNFSLISLTLFLYTTAITNYVLEKYQRYLQLFILALVLPFQILKFYFLRTNPSFLIQKPEPNMVIYSTFTSVYLLIFILYFVIFGYILSILSFKSLIKETRFKGKLLFIAFSLFLIGAIMDTLEMGLLLDFIDRLILIFSVIFFYYGFIIPNDITERMIAEKLIRESEKRFRSTFEQAAVGMAHVALEGPFLRVNKKFCEIIGSSTKELLSKSIHDLNLTEQPLEKDLMFQKLKQNKISLYDTEKKYIKQDGTFSWIKITASNLLDSKKRIKYFIFVIQDISDKKKAEEQLELSEKNFRDAYNNAELYKDIFVHDISNILQNIWSADDLLNFYKEKSDESDVKSLINIINIQVIRGAMLISNIRNLSKLERGNIEKKQINIINVLKDAIEFIESTFKQFNLKIEIEYKEFVLNTDANDLLLEIFNNILINAIRHNKNECSEILINVFSENNYIKIQFIDNGVGVDDSRKEIIFQREKSEIHKNNTGLGLSVTKKIIESYKGRIWVEDRVFGDYSKGSMFIITLPKT